MSQVQVEHESKIANIAVDHESHDTAIKQLQQDIKALQASHSIIHECKQDLAEDVLNIESSPELPRPDDEEMPPA